MAMTWISRFFCPWLMCFIPCPRAGASANPISLTLTQPTSRVIPQPGNAHWLLAPKLGWISPVLGPLGFHSIRFLGFCNGLLMQRYFWQNMKGSIRRNYRLLAMMWFLIYVGKCETNQDLVTAWKCLTRTSQEMLCFLVAKFEESNKHFYFL